MNNDNTNHNPLNTTITPLNTGYHYVPEHVTIRECLS